MITAKEARALTKAHVNKTREGNILKDPAFKKIAKFMEGKITAAAKDGEASVFVTLEDISVASGLPRAVNNIGQKIWIGSNWIAAIGNCLEDNGYKWNIKHDDFNWGIEVGWEQKQRPRQNKKR